MPLVTRASRVAVFSLATVLLGAARLPPAPGTSRSATCVSDRTQATLLQSNLSQTKVWDDAKVAKARASLENLVASRRRLIELGKRLNGAEQSATYAANFGRSGEATYWRRIAIDLHRTIELERARAKSWAADAGVHCPGCTYTDLISKVRLALDQAETSRAAVHQSQEQLADYNKRLAAAGCI